MNFYDDLVLAFRGDEVEEGVDATTLIRRIPGCDIREIKIGIAQLCSTGSLSISDEGKIAPEGDLYELVDSLRSLESALQPKEQ